MEATDGNRTDPMAETVQAHLKKMYPRQSFTVETIKWTFDEIRCVTSTLHAHHSGLKYWLVDKKTRLIRNEIAIQTIFSEQRFASEAAEHTAQAWALLALCTQRASGDLVDSASLAAWRGRLNVAETVQSPRIDFDSNGPVLRFWSYTTYRSLPTIYMHRISLDANGKLVAVESDGVTPHRKNRNRESSGSSGR